MSAYAQAKLILDRLADPVMLAPRNRAMMERVLRGNIEDICVDVALYDDRSVLDDLIERGFVNAENLELCPVIEQGSYTLSTDGTRLYFEPYTVLGRFDAGFTEVVRDYLHVVMHCLLRHPYDSSRSHVDSW